MKKIPLIDALPTVFGLIAIVGMTWWISSGSRVEIGPGSVIVPAGLATLTTALASVVNAATEHTLGRVHALNTFWFLASASYFCFVVFNYLAHPLKFTF